MKYFVFIIFYSFSLNINYLMTQTMKYEKPFKFKFEYIITKNDTICSKFYLIFNKNDTLNQLDEQGQKQGKWLEPLNDSKQVNVDTTFFSYLSTKTYPKNKDSEFLYINKTLNSYVKNLYFINNSPNKIILFEDGTTKDNVLLKNERDSIKQNSYYLEKYWFGYLFGKYLNNKRIGVWHFIPLVDNNKINKVYNWTGDIDLETKKSKFEYLISIKYEQIGIYKNNKREGLWISKKTDPFEDTNEIYLDYQNNQLKSYTFKENNIIDTFYVIFKKENKTYLKYKNGEILDITFLPYTLKGFGERNYLFQNIYIKDEE